MTATTDKRLVALDDEDLQQLMSLASGADSVELKLTVPDSHHRSTILALGMDPASSTPDEMGAFLRKEQARYGSIIKNANIKVE